MNVKKILLSLALFLVLPMASFAQVEQGSTSNTPPVTQGSTQGSSATASVKLENPIGGIDSIPALVENILDIILTIGVPLIAMAIIYSGYLFVAAQGNPTKLETAKKSLVYVILGAGILLGAYAIASAVVSTVEAIRG